MRDETHRPAIAPSAAATGRKLSMTRISPNPFQKMIKNRRHSRRVLPHKNKIGMESEEY